MRLNKLSLKDKGIFKEYLHLGEHKLSVYNFANIYIWKKLFDIKWQIIEGSLCVFFSDKVGTFLYLEPLSKEKNPLLLTKAFVELDRANKNSEISRIENIEEARVDFYKSLGFDLRVKSFDYLCKRVDLAVLKGNRFKSKRAAFNYFINHYQPQYGAFLAKYKKDCLKLYRSWMQGRLIQNQDAVYKAMMQDSLISLEVALENFQDLNIAARVVKINQEVTGFTFGFKLNKDTFCILYEITDLSVKGLAQYIFRKFAQEIKEEYVNIMDDSGLENLKKVKLSYHPVQLVPAYIAKRP